MKPAIQVENLSKQFHLGSSRGIGNRTLRESVMEGLRTSWNRIRPRGDGENARPADRNDLWALKDVTFAIQPGEVVGLIGRNGAGKSTILKVLSRITEPTSGRAITRGRMGSLLEVGTGFHSELTGRENIYLSGAILGMSRREITRKFDEIVAFAEMDRFLDTPVKRYSSGMYVRLAFAVAAHLDLDILLVDEVLAVGDLDFQKKCLQKMGTIAQGGRTVVFVSHNLGIIHRLCDRAVLLRRGQVQEDGLAADVIRSYMQDTVSHDGRWERPANLPAFTEVVLRRVEILGRDGHATGLVNSEDEFQIAIDYDVLQPTPNFEISYTLRNGEGVTVLTSMDSDTAEWPDRCRPKGRYQSICTVPSHLLAPGSYYLSPGAHIIHQRTLEAQHDVLTFEVGELGSIRTKRNDRRGGVVIPVLDWRLAKVT